MEDCCIYQGIDKLFARYYGHINSWVYFGSDAGVMISWPGAASARGQSGDSGVDELLGNCEQYDPRIRPWYLEATSAPRNLIVLIDASSSMNSSAGVNSKMTKWNLATEVVTSVLSITRFSDAVACIILNKAGVSDSESIDLIEGGEESQDKLLESLDDIQPHGEKLIQEGFKRAFQILRRAEQKEIKTTGCQEVILLITDGLISSTQEEDQYMTEILEMLKEEQETLKTISKASIFVSTIGEDADHRLVKHIACQNNAIWIPVLPGRNILSQMHSFMSFFANQLIQNNGDIIWSRFYEDFLGQGTMTTGTRPIFALASQGNYKGQLLGVAGYDIRLVDLEANGLRYEEILGQLSQHIGECKVHLIDQCQLQVIRGRDHSCPVLYPITRCYRLAQGIIYSSIPTNQHLRFDQAVEFCHENGGRLAEFTSDENQEFLAGIASIDGSWIGMNLTDSSQWSWISGRSVSTKVRNSIRDRKGKNCAAIDSSSVLFNIEARSCSDEKHFICEFKSSNFTSIPICQNQSYDPTTTTNTSSNQTSYQHCFQALTEKQQNLILQDSEFGDLRKQKNQNSVFCPLGLEDVKDPLEVLCCDECLNSTASEAMSDRLEDEDSLESFSDSAFFLDLNLFHLSLFTVILCLIELFLEF